MPSHREKPANRSSTSHFPGVARAGPGSSQPRPKLAGPARPRGQPGSPGLPSSPSDLTAEPEAGVGGSRPRPPRHPPKAHARGPRGRCSPRSPSSRGGLRRPRPVPPDHSRQPTSREGGGRRRRGRREGREGGERKGAAWIPDFPEPARSAHSAAVRVPAAARAPPPSSSSSSSPGAPRPLPPAAARLGLRSPPAPCRPHPQLSGVTPGTRVLAPSFLPSFLPSLAPALALQVPRPGPERRRPLLGQPRTSRVACSRSPNSRRRSSSSRPPRPGKGRVGERALAQPRAPALPGAGGPGR